MIPLIIVIGAIAVAYFTTDVLPQPFQSSDDTPTRLIVTYKPATSIKERDNIASQFKAERLKRLTIVDADVVVAKEGQVQKLAQNPRILRVEEDVQVKAVAPWWCSIYPFRCPSPSPSQSPLPSPSPSPTPTPTPTLSPQPSPSPQYRHRHRHSNPAFKFFLGVLTELMLRKSGQHQLQIL